MSLQDSWKAAKEAFEAAEGKDKGGNTGFASACKTIDSAYSKLEAAKKKGDEKVLKKAEKNFDDALKKLEAAQNKVLKVAGMVSGPKGSSPRADLVAEAREIVAAAKKAKVDLLG